MDICALRRDADACTFAQSDCAHLGYPGVKKFLHADNEDSDQTARVLRLISGWAHLSEGTFLARLCPAPVVRRVSCVVNNLFKRHLLPVNH